MQNWTTKEFKMYVLAYASHCNLEETKEELQLLLTHFDEEEFYKIHNEIVQDKERKRVQKIEDYLLHCKMNHQEKNELLANVKTMLFADGTVDVKEKESYFILKRLLS